MMELSVLLALIEDSDKQLQFEKIYNRYEIMMYQRAYQKLNDVHLAEDMVNETMLKIAKNMQIIRVDNEKILTGFVMQMLENTTNDFMRKWKPGKVVPVWEELSRVESTKNDVQRLVDLDPLARAMVKLPDMYLQVIQLKYYYGYSNEDIARLLDCTRATIDKRLSRGRKMLKDSLRKEGQE